MSDAESVEPTFDRRLAQAATQLLLGPLVGSEPERGPDRAVVSEQDAVDAVLLLTGLVVEQRSRGGLPFDVATRMAALLMVVRERLRPLPADDAVAGGGSDLLAADLAELVSAIRRAVRPDEGG